MQRRSCQRSGSLCCFSKGVLHNAFYVVKYINTWLPVPKDSQSKKIMATLHFLKSPCIAHVYFPSLNFCFMRAARIFVQGTFSTLC